VFTTTTANAPVLTMLAGFVMVVAGTGKKRLTRKVTICRVCHRPHLSCTCRWL
jgi:hypothetical protein